MDQSVLLDPVRILMGAGEALVEQGAVLIEDNCIVAFGDNANSAICDEMMASIGSTRSQDYSQCVSDLF